MTGKLCLVTGGTSGIGKEADIATTNGVIHVIDKVILPELAQTA
jgi:uncharacterized surface protein with fasciclin (FAS1) repeats